MGEGVTVGKGAKLGGDEQLILEHFICPFLILPSSLSQC
jgi:hypothetical protein